MMTYAMFDEFVQLFVFFFGLVGALILIYGGLTAVVKILELEILKKPFNYTDIRRDFTSKIVFSLEFFVAADVLNTLLTPTMNEIILLGGIVFIRTFLAYFMGQEAKEL